MLRRPPGWWFHAALVVPTTVLLWAVSVPGVDLIAELVGALALTVAAALWAVRGVGFVVARRRGRSAGRWAWFLVAPAGGVLLVLLFLAGVPLRLRWAASESAFERWAARAPSETSRDHAVDFDVPGHIGRYGITRAFRQGDAVVFFEATGSFTDDAGFAYLPSGPFPELSSGTFEAPRFHHLHGDWYTWTASW